MNDKIDRGEISPERVRLVGEVLRSRVIEFFHMIVSYSVCFTTLFLVVRKLITVVFWGKALFEYE